MRKLKTQNLARRRSLKNTLKFGKLEKFLENSLKIMELF
ncbi:hypothetical protein CSE_00550 [Caldisericum exile AZM16c01]|uniref:Uncharacterized protein n=1 Tax=Caldisericum exile (strain DSM 21853 / NBRC 104410 / AZM16c01) TaxID=511051 RepID=A0A7U6JDZ2_CALEA|nr:hypothetical protein CSE_00550 [Caldisericum exile AZM16c01]